jgi:hypothetical protein
LRVEKLTVPAPVEGVTAALKTTLVPAFTVVADGEIVIELPVRDAGQAANSTSASIDPRPVTSSYPTPALKPNWKGLDKQFVVPLVHGTILFPEVVSWNADGLLAAKA